MRNTFSESHVFFYFYYFRLIRDTSTYKKCREYSEGRSPSLRLLANCILNVDIQTGAHCSVEDAQATMAIYKKFARNWEKSMAKTMERHA